MKKSETITVEGITGFCDLFWPLIQAGLRQTGEPGDEVDASPSHRAHGAAWIYAVVMQDKHHLEVYAENPDGHLRFYFTAKRPEEKEPYIKWFMEFKVVRHAGGSHFDITRTA